MFVPYICDGQFYNDFTIAYNVWSALEFWIDKQALGILIARLSLAIILSIYAKFSIQVQNQLRVKSVQQSMGNIVLELFTSFAKSRINYIIKIEKFPLQSEFD